jgi:hypothetical protein
MIVPSATLSRREREMWSALRATFTVTIHTDPEGH